MVDQAPLPLSLYEITIVAVGVVVEVQPSLVLVVLSVVLSVVFSVVFGGVAVVGIGGSVGGSGGPPGGGVTGAQNQPSGKNRVPSDVV